MKSLCGADCSNCSFGKSCKGCEATNCKPFGGDCVAAQYIKVGGVEQYTAFKKILLNEINELLLELGVPNVEELYELPGEFVNLPYYLPSGKTVKFLDDKKVYLGCQLEFADMGICYGVVADTGFILVSSYSVNGSEPELIAYKKR